jgi:HAD superfamily hydrolase (TIGR01509 family)
MSKKMIKGIFFDAAGVLYRRASPTADFALELIKNGGFPVEVTSDDLTHLQALHAQASQGQVNHEAYWDQFLMMHCVADPYLRQSYISRIIDYSNAVLPVPGAREALQELKQRSFLLGIVTDTMYPLEWKRRRLEKAGVVEYIDVIACSTVIGVHKPDPGMYLNALQQAHLSPRESAFVGHLAIELRGARDAGMVTVAVSYEPGAVADYYCKSILDLLNIPIFSGIPVEADDRPVK